jgi:hypothetical protein
MGNRFCSLSFFKVRLLFVVNLLRRIMVLVGFGQNLL